MGTRPAYPACPGSILPPPRAPCPPARSGAGARCGTYPPGTIVAPENNTYNMDVKYVQNKWNGLY